MCAGIVQTTILRAIADYLPFDELSDVRLVSTHVNKSIWPPKSIKSENRLVVEYSDDNCSSESGSTVRFRVSGCEDPTVESPQQLFPPFRSNALHIVDWYRVLLGNYEIDIWDSVVVITEKSPQHFPLVECSRYVDDKWKVEVPSSKMLASQVVAAAVEEREDREEGGRWFIFGDTLPRNDFCISMHAYRVDNRRLMWADDGRSHRFVIDPHNRQVRLRYQAVEWFEWVKRGEKLIRFSPFRVTTIDRLIVSVSYVWNFDDTRSIQFRMIVEEEHDMTETGCRKIVDFVVVKRDIFERTLSFRDVPLRHEPVVWKSNVVDKVANVPLAQWYSLTAELEPLMLSYDTILEMLNIELDFVKERSYTFC